MLTTIFLSGEIGHRFGRKHKLAVSSPAEALRALEANHPGFAAYLIAAGDRGVDFRLKVDGESIGEDRVRFERPGKTIRLSPVIAGRKSGTGQIIAGIALVALAFASGQPWLLSSMPQWGFVGSTAWFSAGSFVGALGLSMAVGGISQLLAPMPKGPQLSEGKPSYIFNGPVNTVEQGGPVPLCYGTVLAGTRVASAGIYSDDTVYAVSAPSADNAGEGPFEREPTYPTDEGTATPTNLRGRSLQTRQNLRQLHLLAEGEVEGICDAAGNVLADTDRNKGILLDLTPIQNADGSYAYQEVTTAFRPGLATQEALSGFPAAETETAVDVKVIKGSDKWTNAVQREIPAGSHDVLRVSVRFPALYEIDNKGNRTGSAVHFGIQLRRVADVDWHEVVGGNLLPNGELDGLIQGEATSPYVRSFWIPLKGTGPWQVRVGRESADSTDPTRVQNDLYWHSYATITNHKFTYRHSAILGVSYSAERFANAAAVAVRLKGLKVRVPSNYDPVGRNYTGAWDGQFAGAPITLSVGHGAGDATLGIAPLAADLPTNSPIELHSGTTTYRAYLTAPATAGTTSLSITPINAAISAGATGFGYHLKWTNNPAWIYYDLSTHPRYGLGQYVADAALDKWALYEISRYCDGVDGSGAFVGVPTGRDDASREPRFACNTYIQSSAEAYQVLADLSSCFRGMVYWGTGFITAVQDAPKAPKFSFADANVIDGAFHFSSTAAKARHTVCYVQWNDPDDHYTAKFEEVVDDAGLADLGVRPITIVGFGCTSRGQAKRAGLWKLYTERLENDTVTFQTGLEGARARPGDICRISARFRTANRMYGRLTAVDSGAGLLTLDAPAVIGSGTWTIFVARQDGTQAEFTVTSGAGTHATLTVTGSLAGIVPNAVFILRNATIEPALYRVLNVRELDPRKFEITALLYNESKYGAIETGLKITVPPTSNLPSTDVPAAPGALEFRESFVDTASGTQRFLTCTWGASPSPFVKEYVVEYRGPKGEWKWLDETTNLSAAPLLVTALGDHSFRVFARSTPGRVSMPRQGTYTLAEVSDPDQPTSLQIVPQGQGFFLTWTNPANPNLTVIEIQESLTGTFNDPPAAPSPIVGTAAADKGLKGAFHRGGVTADFHRWYRVRARNVSSGKSAWTSSVNATATVPPSGDSVQIQYSVDGATDWHDTFTTGDRYMRQRIGSGEWSTAIRIIGDDGVRGSRSFIRLLTGTPVWSDAEAEAAIVSYGMTKTALDTVTLYKPAEGEFLGFSATKFWNPVTSSWDTVEQVIDGNLIVHGTVGADQIVAGVSLTSPLIEGGRLILKDSCTICAHPGAEEDEDADTGIVRVNGGGGPNTMVPGDRGGQLDVLGNEYPGVGGSVLLTPGYAENSALRLRDRTGADRIVINPDGTVTISGLVPTAGDVGVFFAASYGASPAATAAENKAAIQAAIDAAGDAGGGSVVLPPGVLLCDAPISTTAENVTVFSYGGTTLKTTDNDTTFIHIRHSGCQFKGFTIDGNRGTDEVVIGVTPYFATVHVQSNGSQIRDIRLLDLRFVHCLNIGVIFFGNVVNSELSFCRFDDFFCGAQCNTTADGNPHRILMFNNDFRSTYAVPTTNFTGAIKISRNPAIHPSVGGEHIVKGNRAVNSGQVGIELFGAGGEDTVVEANIIDGCVFAISLDNASRSIVIGNRVTRFTFLGIELASFSNHCVVIGNNIIGDMGVQQVVSNAVAGSVSGSGNAKVTVTSAAVVGSPVEVLVPVASGDNAAAVAGKIRAALSGNEAVSAAFEVQRAIVANEVRLTAKYSAANDSTLSVEVENDTSSGITTTGSTITTNGVAPGPTGSGVSSSNLGIANNKIVGNYFYGIHGAAAIHIAGGRNYTIENNTFFDCDGTINTQATIFVTIKNNLFIRTRNGGIFIDVGDNNGKDFPPAENFEVVGNTWMDNAANAYSLIAIYDASHGNDIRNIIISDNKFLDSKYTYAVVNTDAFSGKLINYVCERNMGSVKGDLFASLNPAQSDYVGLPFAQSAFGLGHAFEYKTALRVPASEDEFRWYKLMEVHSGQVTNFLFGIEYLLDGAQRRDVFQVSAVPYAFGPHSINKVSGVNTGPTVVTEIIYNGVAESHEIWVKLRATDTAGIINFYFSKIESHPGAKFVIQEPVAISGGAEDEPTWGNVLKVNPDGYEDPAAAIAFGFAFRKKWTLDLPGRVDPLWVKIWSVDFGDVVALHLALENSQTAGDRSRKTVCFITGGPYGQDASITLYPGAYRNNAVVEEVIYNNKDNFSIQEIWLKIAPNPGGPLTLWLSDMAEGVVTAPEFVSEDDLPAWSTNHYRAKWETLTSEMVTRALRTHDILVSAPFGVGGEPHGRLWVRGGTAGGFADRVARLEDDDGNPVLEVKESGDTTIHQGRLAVQPTDAFLNECGLAIEKGTISLAADGVNDRWCKVMSVDYGRPLNFELLIQEEGGDRRSRSRFLCAGGIYGWGNSIMRMPEPFHNEGNVREVAMHSPGGGSTTDLWLKVRPVAASVTVHFWLIGHPGGLIPNPTVGTEPSWHSTAYHCRKELYYQGTEATAFIARWGLFSGELGTMTFPPKARLWIRGNAAHTGDAERIALLEDDSGNPILDVRENGVSATSLNVGEVYKVGGTQVVGSRQTSPGDGATNGATDAANDAPTNAATAATYDGTDTVHKADVTTALNTLGAKANAQATRLNNQANKYNDLASKYNDLAGKFNTLIDRLEAHGLLG